MPSSLKPTRGGGGGGGHRGVISVELKGVIVNQTGRVGGVGGGVSDPQPRLNPERIFLLFSASTNPQSAGRTGMDATPPPLRRIKGSIGGLPARQNNVVEQRRRKLQRRFIRNKRRCYGNAAGLHVQVNYCGSLPRDLDTRGVKQS